MASGKRQRASLPSTRVTDALPIQRTRNPSAPALHASSHHPDRVDWSDYISKACGQLPSPPPQRSPRSRSSSRANGTPHPGLHTARSTFRLKPLCYESDRTAHAAGQPPSPILVEEMAATNVPPKRIIKPDPKHLLAALNILLPDMDARIADHLDADEMIALHESHENTKAKLTAGALVTVTPDTRVFGDKLEHVLQYAGQSVELQGYEYIVPYLIYACVEKLRIEGIFQKDFLLAKPGPRYEELVDTFNTSATAFGHGYSLRIYSAKDICGLMGQYLHSLKYKPIGPKVQRALHAWCVAPTNRRERERRRRIEEQEELERAERLGTCPVAQKFKGKGPSPRTKLSRRDAAAENEASISGELMQIRAARLTLRMLATPQLSLICYLFTFFAEESMSGHGIGLRDIARLFAPCLFGGSSSTREDLTVWMLERWEAIGDGLMDVGLHAGTEGNMDPALVHHEAQWTIVAKRMTARMGALPVAEADPPPPPVPSKDDQARMSIISSQRMDMLPGAASSTRSSFASGRSSISTTLTTPPPTTFPAPSSYPPPAKPAVVLSMLAQTVEAKDSQLAQQSHAVAKLQDELARKDEEIVVKESSLVHHIQATEADLAQHAHAVVQLKKAVVRQDIRLQAQESSLSERVQEKDEVLAAQADTISQCEDTIAELKDALFRKNAELDIAHAERDAALENAQVALGRVAKLENDVVDELAADAERQAKERAHAEKRAEALQGDVERMQELSDDLAAKVLLLEDREAAFEDVAVAAKRDCEMLVDRLEEAVEERDEARKLVKRVADVLKP